VSVRVGCQYLDPALGQAARSSVHSFSRLSMAYAAASVDPGF
jgi:hypothetical protein